MEWAATLTAVLSILAVLLKAWQKGQPARQQEKTDEANQQGRQDLQNGNRDAVAERIDRVLSVQANAPGGGDAGSSSATDEERDACTRRRLVDLGISVGEDPGESRKL